MSSRTVYHLSLIPNIDGCLRWRVKNGQSRETGNIGHKTQHDDKNKKNNIEIQKDEQYGPQPTNWG
jgi:hypothetical protein